MKQNQEVKHPEARKQGKHGALCAIAIAGAYVIGAAQGSYLFQYHTTDKTIDYNGRQAQIEMIERRDRWDGLMPFILLDMEIDGQHLIAIDYGADGSIDAEWGRNTIKRDYGYDLHDIRNDPRSAFFEMPDSELVHLME